MCPNCSDSLQRPATVRDGEEITITDHGKPVAKLVPINEKSPLERSIAEGAVTPPENRSRRKELSDPLRERHDHWRG